MFDLENMTADNVREIASKADELIEIIKNIKATVGTEGKGEVVIEDEGYVSAEGKT